MASFLPEPSPAPKNDSHRLLGHDLDDDDDADTASQRSISLSSPATSPRHSALNDLSLRTHHRDSEAFSKRGSNAYTVETEFGSDADNNSMFSHRHERQGTPDSSAAPSVYGESKDTDINPLPTYPPSTHSKDDRASISSFASTSSRKTRPESLIVNLPNGPIILGVALVDFNHLIGPRVEYSRGEIFEDEEVAKIIPFLALPDGAHLSTEDYSYFHIVPSGPNPTTVFGISCNQQIAASALLVKTPDMTRSTVQKAVVVLASRPVFGPIRAKLGVVTTALFNQRDFTDASILDDFATSLELSLKGQLTESGLYMGTSLRELVHNFRQRTLVLVKALMLQGRIMFHGHPVERLCTYQYSLVSLFPGLLQTLDDCGSPPLASRAPTLSRPTSLKTSDHKSMMAFMGLPLDIFGKDSLFQPYIPLQQMDVLKETRSWLCGSTNSIVTQQQEIDLLVDIETGALEFRNPHIERATALTAADRKWMDDIVTDVNEGWNDQDSRHSLQFKGSDDYLRSKFEEYMSAALSTVKYQDFISKGENSGVIITGGSGGDSNSIEDFNPLWISDFRKTNAYEVWNRITDPVIFDLVEPRHPCNEKPSVVSDIGLRLQEGIQDLKLEQQLAPAREAVTRAVTVGSTNFFKAVEGVRERWAQRPGVAPSGSSRSSSSTLVEVSKADLDSNDPPAPITPSSSSTLRPFSLLSRSPSAESSSPSKPAQSPGSSAPLLESLTSPSKNIASWGAGIGSFLSSRAPVFSLARRPSDDGSPAAATPPQATQVQPDPTLSDPATTLEPAKKIEPTTNTELVTKSELATRGEPVTKAEPPIKLKTEPSIKTEPPTKTKPPPPPVRVVEEDMDVEREPEPLTPQPLKTPAINVTSPGGTTPGGYAEPTTPTAPMPKPRAREVRSNQSARPAGGLWEDHQETSIEVGKGFRSQSSLARKAEETENTIDRNSSRPIKELKLSRSTQPSDDEEAYSGMAL